VENSSKNILIIEDEVLILKSLEMILSSKGPKVQTTTMGTTGLELILNNNFDLIICDLMLNDLSGFDVLEGSLKVYSREDIKNKFIIMSAYNSEQILEKAKSYGCFFLRKPFENIHKTSEEIIMRLTNHD